MNRITVTIADQRYTLLTDGEEDFTQRVAAHVDSQLKELMESGLSMKDAAVLAAMNIAEAYFRQTETADNLRGKMKEYVEEATKLKLELSEAKREIFRLQGKNK